MKPEFSIVANNHPDTLFDEFWRWYPLKKGKAKARTLYKLIVQPGGHDTYSVCKDSGQRLPLHLEATAQEINEACKAYYMGLPKDNAYKVDTTYIPHATTWLNQGRWED